MLEKYIINSLMDIECIFESLQGKGSLYISNYSAAQNINLLKSKGINAILSVARSGLVAHPKQNIPRYLYIPAQDHQNYHIENHFAETFDFIEAARRDGNVLIHCMAGISRSATIVIAYLMKKYRYDLGQVITMMKRRRRKIDPNPGFMTQLKDYEKQIGMSCELRESPEANSRLINVSPAKKQGYRDRKICQLANKNIFTKITPIFNQQQIQRQFIQPLPEIKNEPILQPQQSNNNDPYKRKQSIQKKINKIRQKLINSDPISRKSIEKNPLESRQSSLLKNNNIKTHLRKRSEFANFLLTAKHGDPMIKLNNCPEQLYMITINEPKKAFHNRSISSSKGRSSICDQ